MELLDKHRAIVISVISIIAILFVSLCSIFIYRVLTDNNLKTNETNFESERLPYTHSNISSGMRDLGGLKTANGKYYIKKDKIFRGGLWTNSTARSLHEMAKLHIHQIIDVRSIHEPVTGIAEHPQVNELGQNPAKYNVKYYDYPVNTAYQRKIAYKKRQVLGEQYRFKYWYSNNPTARKAYHNIIMRLIKDGKSNQPAWITCAQGRDRTGIVSALIEYILGVNNKTIKYDFLLTDEYIPQTSLNEQWLRMQIFNKHVKEKYGSIHGYVRNGLNLSKHDIKLFRKEFLVRTK